MHHLIFSREHILRRSFVSCNSAADMIISRLLPLCAWEDAVEPQAL